MTLLTPEPLRVGGSNRARRCWSGVAGGAVLAHEEGVGNGWRCSWIKTGPRGSASEAAELIGDEYIVSGAKDVTLSAPRGAHTTGILVWRWRRKANPADANSLAVVALLAVGAKR